MNRTTRWPTSCWASPWRASRRYIRVPGQKRTYAVKTEADPSARFADWVNAGLLRMPVANIRKVAVTNYMLDPLTGGLVGMENFALLQNNGEWKLESGEPIKDSVAKATAAALDNLKIVDARPKPPAMAQDLRAGQMRLSLETALLVSFPFVRAECAPWHSA